MTGADHQGQSRPFGLHDLVGASVTAVLFALLAHIGELTRDTGGIAALWLANGVLAAAVLRSRVAVAPLFLGIAGAANMAVNLAAADTPAIAFLTALANMVEVALLVWLMRQRCGAQPDMTIVSNHAWMVAAAIVTSAVAATIGAIALAPPGKTIDIDDWFHWLIADALGLIIIAPILMIGIDAWRRRRRITGPEIRDWALALAITGVGAALIFAQSQYPFLFLACPLVMLAAFRTGVTGTAASTALLTLIATLATASDIGPLTLVRGDMSDRLTALQLFLATCFAMGLPIAATLEGREAARRALRDARDFNQELLDNIAEVIFKADAEGRWTFLNPAWEALTGYSVKESLGWYTTRLLHPDDLEKAKTEYPRIVSGEIGRCTLRQRFRNQSGALRYIDVTIRRLVDADGAFAGTIGNLRDVTDTVAHEKTLADSEARFRRLAEAAPVGIFRADANGQVSYVNSSWATKVGMRPDELLGDGWMRAVTDLTPYQESPPWQGFSPGEIRYRTIRFRGADGADLWMETVNSAEFDAEGQVTGFVGVAIDITERKAMIDRLAESERRFQALANLAPVGIFRTDTQGRYTYVNAAWMRLTGLGDTEWQGDGWTRVLHPEDFATTFSGWTEAVRERQEFHAEFRWQRPDGEYTWVEALCRPEVDEAGSIIGFIGVTMDITERRRAEAELAEREEQLTLLANNATDAVFRLGLDGNCLYASPSARDLLGVPPIALVGHNMLARFHPDDRPSVIAAFTKLAEGEVDNLVIAYRSQSIRSPGHYKWLEAHCGLVRHPDTNAPHEVIASIRDVSRNKALEEGLKRARERAEAASSAKTALLTNVSEEIRMPMDEVIAFAESVLASGSSEEQRRGAERIAKTARAMIALLDDIIDISDAGADGGGIHVPHGSSDTRH